MPRISRVTAVKIALGFCAVGLTAGLAHAWPTNSPSARVAARLKYYPPRGWLRHYLGDDRYKIAGNLWTVATTEQDTYYHRFTCPNMLRQSPNTVIGFASPSLAAEAGYQPDPVCQPGASAFVYIGPARTLGTFRGGSRTTTASAASSTGRRVLLSDGVSSVIVPTNWQRIQTGALGAQRGVQSVAGQAIKVDAFRPVGGIGSLMFMSMPLPAGVNVDRSKWLTAQALRASVVNDMRNRRYGINTTDAFKDVSLIDSRLGSVPSVTIVPKAGSRAAVLGGRFIIAARGGKVMMVMESGKAPGSRTIINSFRSR